MLDYIDQHPELGINLGELMFPKAPRERVQQIIKKSGAETEAEKIDAILKEFQEPKEREYHLEKGYGNLQEIKKFCQQNGISVPFTGGDYKYIVALANVVEKEMTVR